MDYQDDIEQEARDFIQGIRDDVVGAMVEGHEWDRNDIDNLDESFDESITDRAYTLQDAAYIIAECENEETDSGLWEGQQPEDAIQTKAAFSFSLDVWFKCEEMYKELIDTYEEAVEERDKKEGDATDQELAQSVFDAWEREQTTEPVEDKQEQKRLIERWLHLNEDAGWFGGYPVGSSYIDARCGSGHGMPNIKDFVDFDHEIALKIPAIQGMRKGQVQAHLEELQA